MPLRVDLVSADRTVWSGDATMIVARSVDGDLGILPGHSPVLAVLAEGDVQITASSGERLTASVAGGFLSVEHDRVTIVSDAARLGSATDAR